MTRSASTLARSLVCLAFVGCGAGAPEPSIGGPASASAPPQPPTSAPAVASSAPPIDPTATGEDWSRKPLRRTRDALGSVAISLELPESPIRRASQDKHLEWWFRPVGDRFLDPVIMVTRVEPAQAASDAEILALRHGLHFDEGVRFPTKTQRADGTLLVTTEAPNGQAYWVVTQHRKGDVVVRCEVGHRTGTGRPGEVPIVNAIETRKWAERICASLEIE